MAEGRYLHLRLFLEGIEVPVIAASVQVTANTPASCSIQVVATDKVLDLLPRTVVHLFYYDYIQAGNIATDRKRRADESEEDYLNSKYKLLFMGELVTIKFQKAHNQRAVVLECADFSNYWDTTFQYNFQGSLFGGRRKAAFIGANSNFFTSPLGHGTGTISRLLNGRSANFPELRGLLAGVVRMLEAIGGSYYGTNTFRGANDFSSVAELRVKVLQQITAAEKDTSTAKLFARKAFNMWMKRSTGSLGKLVSFRGLVKTCFGFIFHEVYPCPVARFVPSSTKAQKRNWRVGLSKTKYAGVANEAKHCRDLLIEVRENLLAWRRTRLGNSTNAAVSKEAGSQFIKIWAAWNRSSGLLTQQCQAIGPKGAQKDTAVVGQAAAQIRSLIAPNGTIRLDTDGKMGTVDRNQAAVQKELIKAENALNRILGIKIGRSKTVTVPTESRVNNQIFRPDIWYAPPPRCNVIFPEMYDSFSFSRQFLREVSRLELQTHNEILGNDRLFNGRYYAPNVADVRRGVKLSSRRFARLILDHELYTGIIPMFENLSEANLFAMRSGKSGKSGAKVSYAQRAVNFQYFKYRFESRGMDCTGRFNPPFVPGFPGLIVDKPMDLAQLKISSMNLTDQAKALGIKGSTSRSQLLSELVSPQYMGVCATMAHSISQEGGRTQYQFIHARVHRESTEFLGVDKASVSKAVGTSTRKPYAVAATAANPPKNGSSGLRGGRITKVRDVTRKYMGRYLPVWGDNKASKVRVGTKDDVSSTFYGANQSFFGQVERSSAGITDADAFKAYEVTETRTSYKKEEVDLPIEEAIRPPWIWDGWANPKVSETYDQIFGTGSITDIGGFLLSPNDPEAGTRNFAADDDIEGLRAEQAAQYRQAYKNARTQRQKKSIRDEAKEEAAKSQNAVLMQEKERTIENSVDFLVRSYSFVKANNLDVGDFLRAYAWRPVATMVDILGGADLEIKETSKSVRKVVKQRRKLTAAEKAEIRRKKRLAVHDRAILPDDATDAQKALAASLHRRRLAELEKEKDPKYGIRYVTRTFSRVGYEVSGKEGFHSRAFGDVEDLFGLVSPTVTRVLGLSNNKRKVAAKMDVRKRRRAVVRSYVAELTGSRGLLG
jgi:hypothetical protein